MDEQTNTHIIWPNYDISPTYIGFTEIFGDFPSIHHHLGEIGQSMSILSFQAGLCRELREKRLADMERSGAGHRQKLLERWCGSSVNEAVTS